LQRWSSAKGGYTRDLPNASHVRIRKQNPQQS
jgi:hypothetical protein